MNSPGNVSGKRLSYFLKEEPWHRFNIELKDTFFLTWDQIDSATKLSQRFYDLISKDF